MSELRALALDTLNAASRTAPGRSRANNEDLPLLDPARGIFGVIDGVGGEAGGEIAAAIARDVILQRLARPIGTAAERVREAIAIANNEIFRRAQETPELRGMACVITLAVIADGRAVIGHVGDTRLYKIRAEGLRKVTRDHSPVGEREDAGDLSEVDAMRHPRRNEVFRDVGSLFRDKDEQEFVDIIDEPAEPDAAILICSDGLSDMLPSPTIAHIVRQYAGDPARVVDALVAAANDAGGKDNITVVYAEGAHFAAALRGELAETLTPTEPLPLRQPATERPAATGPVRRAMSAIVRSRTTWFVGGLLLGVLGAIVLMLYVARTQVRVPETLVVAADGSGRFTRIAEAMAVAQPGDQVRLEPGDYSERVTILDGVDLVARIPGSVTIRRPEGLNASIPSVMATGTSIERMSGIRIAAPANGGTTAIAVAAGGLTADLLDVVGHSRALEMAPHASIALHGSRIQVAGPILSVPEGGQASLLNSIFVAGVASAEPPLAVGPAARLSVTGNVFHGFGPEIVRGASAAKRKELLDANIVTSPPPPPRRPRENRR